MGKVLRMAERRERRATAALLMLDEMRGRVLVPLKPDVLRVMCGPFEWKEAAYSCDGFRIDAMQPVCDETELPRCRGVSYSPGSEVFVLASFEGGVRHGDPCFFTLDDFMDAFTESGDGKRPS